MGSAGISDAGPYAYPSPFFPKKHPHAVGREGAFKITVYTGAATV